MGRAQVNLLVDTHIWIWALLETERLTDRECAALEDPESTVHLSSVSVWEALLLAERGRISLGPDPHTWIDHALRVMPMIDMPITRAIAARSRRVDLPHQDPADRFIAATAIEHSLTVVTRDAALLAAPEVMTLAS